MKGGHAYTPAKTVAYERSVVQAYKLSYPREEPLTGPLEMKIDAYMPIPESWPKSKKAAALAEVIKPTVKPDIDNIGKVICDALNGIAYQDDKQITALKVKKLYGTWPHVDVEIWSEDSK
jgi:Holliday junction resolvase RusA-like endonuclease